jgi:hypothetical protein
VSKVLRQGRLHAGAEDERRKQGAAGGATCADERGVAQARGDTRQGGARRARRKKEGRSGHARHGESGGAERRTTTATTTGAGVAFSQINGARRAERANGRALSAGGSGGRDGTGEKAGVGGVGRMLNVPSSMLRVGRGEKCKGWGTRCAAPRTPVLSAAGNTAQTGAHHGSTHAHASLPAAPRPRPRRRPRGPHLHRLPCHRRRRCRRRWPSALRGSRQMRAFPSRVLQGAARHPQRAQDLVWHLPPKCPFSTHLPFRHRDRRAR